MTKWIKSVALWLILEAIACSLAFIDRAGGDAGMALAMVYGSTGSYVTVCFFFHLAEKEW